MGATKGMKYSTDHSRMIAEEGKKPCGRCGLPKPLEEFHRSRSKASGYESYCKPCKLTPAERERHNRRSRDHKFLVRYGITRAERDQMALDQGGRCAICGDVELLHVDHCHATGKVRGLICFRCNTMLGTAKDQPVILLAAIKYLEERS
jgi:hypothetical protein